MDYRKKTNRELKTSLDALQGAMPAFPVSPNGKTKSRSQGDLRQVVHELEVHQIELEMQNREMREVQEELESSRNRYAELYDFAPVGYADFDQNGVVQQINLTGADLLGRVRARLIGNPFSLFLSTGDAIRFSDHLRQCWKTHTKQIIDLNLQIKGRPAIPVQLSTIAVEAPEKTDWICRSILTDITESKRSAEALRLSEERLRIALEAAHIGTWDWNIVAGQIAWGGQHDQLFGSISEGARDSYEGFVRLVHLEDRELVRSQMRPAIAQGGGCHFEFRVIWPDGSLHWIQAEGRVFPDASGRPVRMLGVLMETTLRKETEAQLRIAHEELEQRVTERTAELAQAISALQQEVVERKEAQEGRQRLFRELVTAQEEERRRISRELHDQMGQHLTALILGLKSIQGALHSDTQLRQLRDLQNLTDDIGQQVHRIAFELRPTALDDLGLSTMLLNHMDEWSERFGIGVDFHSGGLDEERLSTEIETTIYRIVQEALTNVVKHAQASHLSLILVRGDDHLLTIIEDNGKGFDVDKVTGSISGPHHLGLLGMKERVALAGGTLELESSPGRGATLFIRIPLPPGLKEKLL